MRGWWKPVLSGADCRRATACRKKEENCFRALLTYVMRMALAGAGDTAKVNNLSAIIYLSHATSGWGEIMTKLVREFVKVQDHSTLDRLIETLISVRDGLPAQSQDAEIRLQGDDIFGRHLSISYLREQTAEEAECDARYADAYEATRRRQLEELQAELAALEASKVSPLSIAA